MERSEIMRILANRRIKRLFSKLLFLMLLLTLGIVTFVLLKPQGTVIYTAGLSLAVTAGILYVCYRYFALEDQIMDHAVETLDDSLSGNKGARLPGDEEGELSRLFHEVNSLVEILNAHVETESRSKEFLKDTISDISHQLKTPLAALSLYNEILQGEAAEDETIQKFTNLSQQELDRISSLVNNLLKIAKLDAETTPLNQREENVSEITEDVHRQFSVRAEQERKDLSFSGDDTSSLLCDVSWIREAIANIVQNALDHTQAGDTIRVEWKTLASIVQITVRDTGSGIHPEDLHHIFKRFYRSRYSKDMQGIGLGLSLSKAVIEAHNGTIEVDSELGRGCKFTINFPIPTKL